MRPTLSLSTRNDFKATIAKLSKEIRGSFVKVGVLATKADRLEVVGEEPATNVEIAISNEFGVPGRIPERSFLRSTFAKNEAGYFGALGALLGAVVKGADVRKGLALIGLQVSSDMKAAITQGAGITPANAPSTLAGKLSTRPLIGGHIGYTRDDGSRVNAIAGGQLVNSISHEVVKPGAK